MSGEQSEWERVGRERHRFQGWFEEHIRPVVRQQNITGAITETVAFQAWLSALGLDFNRAQAAEIERLRSDGPPPALRSAGR